MSDQNKTSDQDKTPEAPSGPDESGMSKKRLAGVAVGIGSAAIVAALLYANRSRKGDKGGPAPR